jgi:hypothetical protein
VPQEDSSTTKPPGKNVLPANNPLHLTPPAVSELGVMPTPLDNLDVVSLFCNYND